MEKLADVLNQFIESRSSVYDSRNTETHKYDWKYAFTVRRILNGRMDRLGLILTGIVTTRQAGRKETRVSETCDVTDFYGEL
jgi:hypothetical protein